MGIYAGRGRGPEAVFIGGGRGMSDERRWPSWMGPFWVGVDGG